MRITGEQATIKKSILEWSVGLSVLVLGLFPTRAAVAQDPLPERLEAEPAFELEMNQSHHSPLFVTPLAMLVEEAERNNPQVLASRHAWQAAAQVPSQASTLPDPQVVLQQLNVGSPRPFAGFTNSDFAYLGVGVSQDLPYPGKLRLKGEIAQRDASSARDRVEVVRRSVVERVKATYFELAYVQQTLAILQRDDKLLDQIAKTAEARYRVGQGNQQEVLKAQLQRTKLLGETAMHHQHMATLEAQLKQLVNRSPDAPDMATEQMTQTPLPYTSDELLARVRTENPDVASEQDMVRRQSLQVELARKDFYPDFNLQYMWQHTAEQFRDYHMISFGVRIPIYRGRKQRPELAQTVEQLNQSRREYEGQVQQAYFDVRDQFLRTQTAEQLLKIYHDGLIPQATATFQAALVAYQSNREDFGALLSSFLDVLQFDEEYWKTLADHETALARVEQLTGLTLR
jgi:outer membrane protein, heavy metal efflux system